MAKSKVNVPNILQAIKDLKNGKVLPVYYLFGEDSFNIDICLKTIKENVKPLLSSDFDEETFYGEKANLNDILDFASAFPFGDGKKLIFVKEAEKIKDKKSLTSYAASPPDFTVLVFIHEGNLTTLGSEPFKTLINNKFIYAAKELKGNNLVEWLIDNVASKGKKISGENARFLIDIVGENKSLIEAQLDKIFLFLGEEHEITLDSIKSLSTELKEYSIFDLQNAISKKDKNNSIKIAFQMLEKGAEPTFIISMLTRYFTGLSKVNELREKKVADQTAARIVGTHPYYYKDYIKARNIFNDRKLYKVVKALLKADIAVKTTAADKKTVISLLIAEIIQ